MQAKSNKIYIRYFAAFCLYIFILGKESQQFTYLKQQKIENESSREMLHKIIHWKEGFQHGRLTSHANIP